MKVNVAINFQQYIKANVKISAENFLYSFWPALQLLLTKTSHLV